MNEMIAHFSGIVACYMQTIAYIAVIISFCILCKVGVGDKTWCKLWCAKGLLCVNLLVIFICIIFQSTGFPSTSTGYQAHSTVPSAVFPDGDKTTGVVSTRVVDFEQLANAIYKAENSERYPYGIIAPYCTAKTPQKCRKGCLQTIEKRYRMWLSTNPATRDSQTFIVYLSRSYAPLNAKNDPSGLNKNWVKNVSHFYGRLTNVGLNGSLQNEVLGHG